eukprot:6199233-Pleurochrysis_carterae.AAC.2
MISRRQLTCTRCIGQVYALRNLTRQWSGGRQLNEGVRQEDFLAAAFDSDFGYMLAVTVSSFPVPANRRARHPLAQLCDREHRRDAQRRDGPQPLQPLEQAVPKLARLMQVHAAAVFPCGRAGDEDVGLQRLDQETASRSAGLGNAYIQVAT